MDIKILKSKKSSYIISLVIAIISFLIFSVIFSDWEHFKQGLFGY